MHAALRLVLYVLAAGFEARGLIFGAPLALALGCAFVPLRKPGKLPGNHVLVPTGTPSAHICAHVRTCVQALRRWVHACHPEQLTLQQPLAPAPGGVG
jgi:hypothetical protein